MYANSCFCKSFFSRKVFPRLSVLYLWLGTYNEDYYFLIEMQSGQIYRVDMGRIRLTTKDEARADILKWALPFFHSFEDLVRCFFADELYDEEEMIFVAE